HTLVGAVHFIPGSPVPHDERGDVADPFILSDALENEGRAWIKAPRLAHVVRATVEASRRRPDTDDALRRTPAMSPRAAGLAGRAGVALAGRQRREPAATPAAHLDHGPRA